VNDDWRLRVSFQQAEDANRASGRLEATELERDLVKSLHDRVIISRDDAELFCYGGTRDQVADVEQSIRSIAGEHGWQPEFELRHWHPVAEEWEDPDAPLPSTDAERQAERAEAMKDEREQSASQGFPEFEVRVQCHSHADAIELSEKLKQEGVPHVRRWKYILVGAADEDSAGALAERLRGEAPAGSTATVEGNMRAVYAERPTSAYVTFPGLGG
jgi:hypothetical protein